MSTLQAVETVLHHLPAAGSREAARMSTSELRAHFLAEGLFAGNGLRFFYAESDRMLIGGIRPQAPTALPQLPELGTEFFLERRELGVLNIGAPGTVRAGSHHHVLNRLDCLYLGMGCDEVEFDAVGDGTPEFYVLSCPAHKSYPDVFVRASDALTARLGTPDKASCRTIQKYICPEIVPSCQLTMGITTLAANSVWNTMPTHTHSRRTEVYLYFDLDDGMVVHLMGCPDETRHLIVHDREAIFSPSWSIHSGAGTNRYSFAWGMAGENQDFGDIDPVSLSEMA